MSLSQAVLLVGGRGTRMWPLTATVPKGLIPVAGVPFLDLQIDQLASIGVERVLLAVGVAQLEQWEQYAGSRDGVELIVEDEPLDTAGPVRAALDRLDERFLVLNGDVVVEADIAAFVADADDEAEATLALVEVDDTSAYGVVVVGSDGRVSRFVEKPPTAEAPAQTVNAGMYVMSRDAIAGYPLGRLSFERTVFPDLVARGVLTGVLISGRWLDIGTPELFLECTGAVLRGDTSLASAESEHVGAGGIRTGEWSWVDPAASVADDARIVESVVLAGATVAAGAVVEESVIGWGAVVGEGSTVKGSAVIGADAIIGSDNEIGRGMRVADGAEIPPSSMRFSPPE